MDPRPPSDEGFVKGGPQGRLEGGRPARRHETWGDWLLRDGGLPPERVRAALERRRIYGGGLDTALLELNVVGETGVWARLASATGLPVPPPTLCDPAQPTAAEALPAEVTAPLRAVPIAREDRVVRLFCAEPVDAQRINAAVARVGLTAHLFIVPEVRLLVARSEVYGEPLPPRYATLAARTLGSRRVRRLGARPSPGPGELAKSADPTPTPTPTPTRPQAAAQPARDVVATQPTSDSGAEASGPGDFIEELNVATLWDDLGAQPAIPLEEDPPAPPRRRGSRKGARAGRVDATGDAVPMEVPEVGSTDAATEALCRRARDTGDSGRVIAVRALRRRLDQAPVVRLRDELRRRVVTDDTDEEQQLAAIDTLAELRDAQAIPALIERLIPASSPIAARAHDALRTLAAQDFALSRRRWLSWWQTNQERPRFAWLIDGLGHRTLEVRALALAELRALAGQDLGYAADAPKRDRDAARERWREWASAQPTT